MYKRVLRGCVYGTALFCAFVVITASAPILSAADAPADKGAKADKPAKVDLNTATDKEFAELPGIGDAYSKKIIKARPLRMIKDLSKLGIPSTTIDKLKPLVTLSIARPGGKLTPPKKGMVWVNTDSKIYHKDDSPWYGNAKNGTWMTEADAIKAGNKATQ